MSARTPASERARKLTAAIYAQLPGVVAHVRETGRLPRMGPVGGAEIGLRLLTARRGADITLTEDERLVYEALARTGETPGGHAILVDDDEPDRGGR